MDEALEGLPEKHWLADSFRLDGKVAVVTGGGSGLGRAMAWGMACQGADLIVVDMNGERAAQFAKKVESELGRRATVVQADMRDESSLAGEMAKAFSHHAHVDILVNAAGHNARGPLLEMPTEEFSGLMDVHVKGAFHMCQLVGPRMQAQGCGSIINVASVAGLVGVANIAAYGAAKGALIQLTRALALEMAPDGVRVNALAPGYIDTPLTRQHPEAKRLEITQGTPLGRFGEATEMMGPCLFLASRASSFVTGSVLVADGGWTTR